MSRLRLSMAFAALIALFGLRLAAAPPLAAADPEVLLHRTVDEVLEAAYPPSPSTEWSDRAERVLPILEKAFDFAALTRRAIGPGWRQFSEGERQRSINDFRELVVRTYASRMGGGERPRVAFGKLTMRGEDSCEIATQVSYAGNTYAVTYRMERDIGKWRVTDVVIEGVSFVSNYRAQFDEIMQKGGSSAVIRAMESRLAQTSQGMR